MVDGCGWSGSKSLGPNNSPGVDTDWLVQWRWRKLTSTICQGTVLGVLCKWSTLPTSRSQILLLSLFREKEAGGGGSPAADDSQGRVCWPNWWSCAPAFSPSVPLKSVATISQPVELLPQTLLVRISMCVAGPWLLRDGLWLADPVWPAPSTLAGVACVYRTHAWEVVSISCPWSLPEQRENCVQYRVFRFVLKAKHQWTWRRFLTSTMHVGENVHTFGSPCVTRTEHFMEGLSPPAPWWESRMDQACSIHGRVHAGEKGGLTPVKSWRWPTRGVRQEDSSSWPLIGLFPLPGSPTNLAINIILEARLFTISPEY